MRKDFGDDIDKLLQDIHETTDPDIPKEIRREKKLQNLARALNRAHLELMEAHQGAAVASGTSRLTLFAHCGRVFSSSIVRVEHSRQRNRLTEEAPP